MLWSIVALCARRVIRALGNISGHIGRLQSLGDALEERARQPSVPECRRGLIHSIARHARDVPHWRLGDAELAEELATLTAVAEALDGHRLAEPVTPAPALVPLPSGMRAGALAEAHGITDRWARTLIRRGAEQGLPGFHRVGWEWRAEPEAFAQFRVSSELPAGDRPAA